MILEFLAEDVERDFERLMSQPITLGIAQKPTTMQWETVPCCFATPTAT